MPGLEQGDANFGRWRTPVRGAPEVLGHVPVSCLAEEIATPGDGQIKALFTVAGNPVLVDAGGDRLDAALETLDCMISVDNWINETTRHAHVILPGLSALEQAHHDDLILGFAVRQRRRTTRRRSSRRTDRPQEWEILIRLAGACLGESANDVDVAIIDDGFFDVARVDAGLRRLDPCVRSTTTVGPSACSTSRCAPARSATATARTPSGLTLDELTQQPARHRPRPDGAAPRRDPHTPSGQVELAPAVHHGRPTAPRRPARSHHRTISCSPVAVTCVRTTRGCTTSRCW